MIGLRAKARDRPQPRHRQCQHPGGPQGYGLGDDKEGIDTETAQGEQQRHDKARRQPGGHQRPAHHHVKGDGHRQEHPDNGHRKQGKEAKFQAQHQIGRQQRGHGCPEKPRQQHQRHGHAQDEPQVDGKGAGGGDQGGSKAFPVDRTVAVPGQLLRAPGGWRGHFGRDNQAVLWQKPADQRHDQQDQRQAEGDLGQRHIDRQQAEQHGQNHRVQGWRGNHRAKRGFGPHAAGKHAFGNWRCTVDTDPQRRAQGQPQGGIGKPPGKAAPLQAGGGGQEGGGKQDAEGHALEVGIDPVQR